MDPCAFLQVVQVEGAKGCGFDPRRSATFHTVDPCKKAVFACLARRTCNKLKTIHYTHWHLFCCRSSETGLDLTAGGVVSLTIHTKSSERCDVDHVGMSGNLCKTTTPGANESDFCRQVWSQCKQMNILAVKVAWASWCESQPVPNAHA